MDDVCYVFCVFSTVCVTILTFILPDDGSRVICGISAMLMIFISSILTYRMYCTPTLKCWQSSELSC